MSGNFIIESFCYGNINQSSIKLNDELLDDIIHRIKSDTNRSVKSLWCLVGNVKKLQLIYSINSLRFLNFVKELFDSIDIIFPTFVNNTNINFDNPLMVKVFILNEIMYSMDSFLISGNKLEDNIEKTFNANFEDLVIFINANSIMTTYDVPYGASTWLPIWTIVYKENSLSNDVIDIYNDNFLIFSNVKYSKTMKNVLEKIYERLLFLKEVAPEYYENLVNSYISVFTQYVFEKYPYAEIINSYMKFVELTDRTYIPEKYSRDGFTKTDLMFSMLPISLSSYVLGFPVFSIGTLAPHQVMNMGKKLNNNIENFYNDIIEKNKQSIKSRIYLCNVGNNIEGYSYINNLYIETDHYNYDDIILLFTGGFYFIFNYPEFQNLSKTTLNPYNRDVIDTKYINNMAYIINEKNIMINEVRKRGLKVELSGTMRENYDEICENISINIPEVETFTSNNILRMVFSNLIREDF